MEMRQAMSDVTIVLCTDRCDLLIYCLL